MNPSYFNFTEFFHANKREEARERERRRWRNETKKKREIYKTYASAGVTYEQTRIYGYSHDQMYDWVSHPHGFGLDCYLSKDYTL